jgi:chromatin segregation and condensation protein Rec8/ScpA/Scc1 (kleisin family)
MSEKAVLEKKTFVLSPPSVFEQFDEFLANIEENIQDYYAQLIKLSIRGLPLSFTDLVKGQTLIEAVRVFIMLLFLANEKKILLSQDEAGSDLLIRLGEVSPPIV